jgi:arabinose-5-phosphate isomerase
MKNSFELFTKSYSMQVAELSANATHIEKDSIEKAVDIIFSMTGKLILSGMGKSGLIAQKLAATFSSTGTPAFFLHPGESLHGDLGVVQPGDVLIILAKSGESDEVTRMLQSIRQLEVPVISILANEKSSVGRMSDVVIHAKVSREADSLNLAPTASTTVALVVGDALASAIAELREFKPEHFAMFHPAGQLGKRLLLSVSDFIRGSEKSHLVSEDATVDELLKASFNAGAVIIINKEGKISGLVTDGDLRRGVIRFPDFRSRRVSEIMTADPITVSPETLAFEALKIMEDRPSQISVLPVVYDDQKPAGLLRLHDLVRAGL